MNAALAHLTLNHFPVVTLFVGLGFLAWALCFKSQVVRQFALILLTLAAIFVAPAYLSGEGAEDIIEDKPGVEKNLIHEHEEAAEFALISMILTGVVSVGALYTTRKQNRHARKIVILTAVVGLWAATVIARTAHLGGQIRHEEIRSSVPTTEAK